MAVVQEAKEDRQAFWRGHVVSWRESGLSQIGYCRQNHLRAARFSYWKRRFDDEDASDEARASVRLVRLPLAEEADEKTPLAHSARTALRKPDAPSKAGLELQIGGRFWIKIAADFDVRVLQKLIQTLEAL